MKIQWLGHSAFRLTESTGITVITDPYAPKAVGYGMAYVPADIVTVSHPHSDHNCLSGVKGSPTLIDEEGMFEIKGIEIHGISSFHDKSEGKERGSNIIYKIRMDGVTVCHLGDIGEECSPELIEQLLPVNVLLIPVGGNYTIDAEAAKEYVDRIMPDIVIPMHYRIKHTELDIDKADGFLRLIGDEFVTECGPTIELDRSDLGQGDTKVLVPERYKG